MKKLLVLILLVAGCGSSPYNANDNDGGTDASPENCGNGAIDPDEACDGTNLGIATCEMVGNYVGGTLACTETCGFDTSACEAPVGCGDGTVSGTEDCDGVNLDGNDCTTVGAYTSGTLTCNGDCTFNVSACTNTQPYCGNGAIDTGEACDGNVFANPLADCLDYGFDAGSLTCSACAVDTSGCYNIAENCGNGSVEVNEGEECDGTNMGLWTSCTDLDPTRYFNGSLGCTGTCTYDTSACVEILNPAGGGSGLILALDNFDDQIILQTFNSVSYDVSVMPKSGGQYSIISTESGARGAVADADSIYYGTAASGVNAYVKSMALTADLGTAGTYIVGQDTDHVYGTANGTAYQYAKTGTPTQVNLGTDPFVQGCSASTGVKPTMNTHAIYWVRSCSSQDTIRYMSLVTYEFSGVSTGGLTQVFAIAADDTNIYWYGYGGGNSVLGKTNRMSDVATILTPPQPNGPPYIAADATHVYWSTHSSNTAFPDGELRRVPIAGGAVEVVVAGIYNSNNIAVDATHVYWANAAYPSATPPVPALVLRVEK